MISETLAAAALVINELMAAMPSASSFSELIISITNIFPTKVEPFLKVPPFALFLHVSLQKSCEWNLCFYFLGSTRFSVGICQKHAYDMKLMKVRGKYGKSTAKVGERSEA